jgi:argininosuccinate lyase
MLAAAREGFSTATDLADYLVKKGLPFRDAHEAVARAVREAESRGCELADLPLEVLQRHAPLAGEEVFDVLAIHGSLASRSHAGGTAPAQVRTAVARARADLARAQADLARAEADRKRAEVERAPAAGNPA